MIASTSAIADHVDELSAGDEPRHLHLDEPAIHNRRADHLAGAAIEPVGTCRQRLGHVQSGLTHPARAARPRLPVRVEHGRPEPVAHIDDLLRARSRGRGATAGREIGAPTNLIIARPAERVVRAEQDYDVLVLLGDDWDEITDLESVLPEQLPPSSTS